MTVLSASSANLGGPYRPILIDRGTLFVAGLSLSCVVVSNNSRESNYVGRCEKIVCST